MAGKVEREFDIVIVGAGLVGAACAALLGRNPALRIALLEANPLPKKPSDSVDPRVVALTEASRQLLDSLGAWQWVASRRACPYTQMTVRDAEGTGLIAFDSAEVRQPNLGHIVENGLLAEALLAVVEEQPNTDIFCPVRLQGLSRSLSQGGAELQVELANGDRLITALLVAADGANSRVRQHFGFRLREWDYGQQAIVASIRTEHAHGHHARQWFMPTGPLAFLPLVDDQGSTHYSAIVWSQQEAEAQRLCQLDEAAFCTALTRASENALGEVQLVSRRYSFPLRQRHAVDYVQQGVVLIGDAAHSIHPLAGQGVNLGFQDARVLAAEVERALVRGLAPGDPSVLGRYQRRRKPDNLAMMALMEGLKRLFEQDAPVLRLARNQGMRRINRLAPLKNVLVRQAMGF